MKKKKSFNSCTYHRIWYPSAAIAGDIPNFLLSVNVPDESAIFTFPISTLNAVTVILKTKHVEPVTFVPSRGNKNVCQNDKDNKNEIEK